MLSPFMNHNNHLWKVFARQLRITHKQNIPSKLSVVLCTQHHTDDKTSLPQKHMTNFPGVANISHL